jgi:ribosome-associated protein
MEAQNLDLKLELILKAAIDKKANDIVILDLQELEGVITDIFVICSGLSERQVEAIFENIHVELKKNGFYTKHVEGTILSQWVLMDYGDIIVHIFLDKIREYYRLEDLWHTAKKITPDF